MCCPLPEEEDAALADEAVALVDVTEATTLVEDAATSDVKGEATTFTDDAEDCWPAWFVCPFPFPGEAALVVDAAASDVEAAASLALAATQDLG